MCIEQVFPGYALEQFALDNQRGFTQCQAGSVGHPQDMRIHGHRWLAEGSVEYHVSRFAPYTR